MKLETVSIKRFRSIESGELSNCGNFNVLIGKNNSGKSNILSAIETFFACIKGGNPITLEPPRGRAIDFFNRKTEFPLEITLNFVLSLAERDALLRDIVTEAPQVKNAVDGIDPSLRLSVTVQIHSRPPSFGFVSKIALLGAERAGGKGNTAERIILRIENESALELFNQSSRSRQQAKSAELLLEVVDNIRRVIPQSEWKAEVRSRGFISEVLRRPTVELPQSLRQRVETLFIESTSPDDFLRAAQALAKQMQGEAQSLTEEVLKNKIDTFAGEQTSIPTYALNLLEKISTIKILHLTEHRKPIGAEEAQQLLSLKVLRGGSEILHNIQEVVSALLGVQIDAFENPSVERRSGRAAELDVDDFLVEVNGSGIREALRLVLDVQFQNPQILLVEEPEIHLHPALETSMMRYLRSISSECQVFVTTHSTNFLDTAEMKNVYLISKAGATKIQHLTFEEAETQIPKELGIRLSSLFMFDRLVFVEGPSDEGVLREWAAILKINLSQSNVGFISMGGVRNFGHFAAEAILSFLTKRQVKVWFIVDRDEREPGDIVKFQTALGEKATAKVLTKRELENYLICPRIILEFIKWKKESAGIKDGLELPTESDLIKAIDACAEKLKQVAISKRVIRAVCKPVYPSLQDLFEKGQNQTITEKVINELQQMISRLEQSKGEVEEVYAGIKEAVEKNWQANKLGLVPGDTLLDLVCKEYGVRFKKEQDGVRLASLMRENEIDQEIRSILEEVGTSKEGKLNTAK